MLVTDYAIAQMPGAATASVLPLADVVDGHRGWGDGWWIVMAIGMVVFWALVIGAAVWLVRELAGRRERPGRESALELLDRRLAEGAVSIEDYERRREALARGRENEAGPAPPGSEEGGDDG